MLITFQQFKYLIKGKIIFEQSVFLIINYKFVIKRGEVINSFLGRAVNTNELSFPVVQNV